ncbi:SoxR reducing system RseC family protein [Candidatus Methylocalor cossyra]|uniref:Sigma factor RpoE regulatory protein RseC n=1 Tax=Candidatus Methylocalor cossyra TaxID=3108543 RepID=A0ABP1C5C6_9GAMM
MIEEEAVVAGVEAGGRVWVEKPRRSACGSCAQPCGTAGIAEWFGQTTARLAVLSPSDLELRVGDRVVVGITEEALVMGSLGAYLLPLLGLLVGAVLGKTLAVGLAGFPADAAAAVGGFAGLGGTIAFLRQARVLSRRELQPVVLRKIS